MLLSHTSPRKKFPGERVAIASTDWTPTACDIAAAAPPAPAAAAPLLHLLSQLPRETNMNQVSINATAPHVNELKNLPKSLKTLKQLKLKRQHGNPNKSKEARRKLRNILDLVCAKYNTTVDKSRCPMKNNRKVTYLLSFGTVDYVSCFIREKKDEIILIPNNYTVCFEANSHVWIGRIQYKERTADSGFNSNETIQRSARDRDSGGPEMVAYFEVTPVDEAGNELRDLSSNFQENISCAFKISLAKMREFFGQTEKFEKASLRPNGRLYIGVYYDTVQRKLREHLKQVAQRGELQFLDENLRERIKWWISLDSNTQSSQTKRKNDSGRGGYTRMSLSAAGNNRMKSALSMEHHRGGQSKPSRNVSLKFGNENAPNQINSANMNASRSNAAANQMNGGQNQAPGTFLTLPAPSLEGFRADSTLTAFNLNSLPHPLTASASFSTPFMDLNILNELSHFQNDLNLQQKLLSSATGVRGQFPQLTFQDSAANLTNLANYSSQGHNPIHPLTTQLSQTIPTQVLQSPTTAADSTNSANLQVPNGFQNISAGILNQTASPTTTNNLNTQVNQSNEDNRKRSSEALAQIQGSPELVKTFYNEITQLVEKLLQQNSNNSNASAENFMNPSNLACMITVLENVKRSLQTRLQNVNNFKNQDQNSNNQNQNASTQEVISPGSPPKRLKLSNNTLELNSAGLHGSSDSISIQIKQESGGNQANIVKAAPPLEFLERSLSHQSLRSFSELCGIQSMTDSLNTAANHETVAEKRRASSSMNEMEEAKDEAKPAETNNNDNINTTNATNSNTDKNPSTKYTEADLQNAYMNSSDIEQIDLGSFFEQPGYYKNSFQNWTSLINSNSNSDSAQNSVDGLVQSDSNNHNSENTQSPQNALPVVVSCNMTPEALYLTLDVQKNESVGEKEIKHALKCLRIPVSSSIVKKTYEACDKNGDGKISMDEFVQYLKEREQELKEMFNKMDLSKDGYVTLEELKAAREMGIFEASDEEIKSLIEWMDNLSQGRKDGKIDYEEFRTSMVLFPPATTIQEIIYCLRNKTNGKS